MWMKHTKYINLFNSKSKNNLGEHGVWMSLLNLSTELLDILVGPLVSVPLRRLLLQWQRAAEFSCDRAALLVSQDYKVGQGVCNWIIMFDVGPFSYVYVC